MVSVELFMSEYSLMIAAGGFAVKKKVDGEEGADLVFPELFWHPFGPAVSRRRVGKKGWREGIMKSEEVRLPARVVREAVDGREIYLVGTAHVSKESVQDVRTTVQAVRPETVCVELCASRHKAITSSDSWKKMDIVEVVRKKKALFLLAQLILTSFYRRLGDQLGVQPGAEMIEGTEQAKQVGAELVLADREIDITLKRVWGHLSFWNRFKMVGHLLGSLFLSEKISEEFIEEMKEEDQLENLLREFAEAFPEVKKRLIDERDIFLSQKIRSAPGDPVVAIVGAAHVPGIRKHIHREIPLDSILEVPPGSSIPAALKWGIPALIAALLVCGFFRGGGQNSLGSIYIWILVNGLLSAVGAAVALGHPLTILASFVAAPLTSLNPMIAAGWVSGLVQAKVHKPTVSDFEDLPRAISTVKGFWLNPVSRILLVVVLANLGSTLGTFISGSWIATRVF
jgi:pheromone shutdown-related protein TraB